MSDELKNLKRVLNQPTPPTEIWQQPFDYDPSHYSRLCDFTLKPSNNDLCDYMGDYRYMRMQPDLLRFLLPRVLHTWGEELFNPGEEYGGFEEQFFEALSAKPLYPKFLKRDEIEATMHYVASLILARMNVENSLCHKGMQASPYKWLNALYEFNVLFPGLDHLWERWWSFPSEPLAICAVQWASCLLYGTTDNPVFAPYTAQEGGGPIVLFGVEYGMISKKTHPGNVVFLKSLLSAEYLHRKLSEASDKITAPENAAILDRILQEFESQSAVLEENLAELQKVRGSPKLQDYRTAAG